MKWNQAKHVQMHSLNSNVPNVLYGIYREESIEQNNFLNKLMINRLFFSFPQQNVYIHQIPLFISQLWKYSCALIFEMTFHFFPNLSVYIVMISEQLINHIVVGFWSISKQDTRYMLESWWLGEWYPWQDSSWSKLRKARCQQNWKGKLSDEVT